MATGETGFSDLMYDLISVQYHALKAGQHYEQFIRDAEDAGYEDIVDFFRQLKEEDSRRAAQCHRMLGEITGTRHAGSAAR